MFYRVKCALLICCIIFLYEITNVSLNLHGSASSQAFTQFWDSIEQIVSSNDAKWNIIANQIAQFNIELSDNSSECYHIIEDAFRKGIHQEWSAKIINSNSFVQSGLVSSLVSEKYTSVGAFQDCLSVNNEKDGGLWFEGKYCLVTLKTPQFNSHLDKVTNETDYFNHLVSKWLSIRNRFPFALGICVPSICNTQQVNALIHKYFFKYLNGIDVNIDYCQQNADQNKKYNFGYILSIVILMMFILVSVASTITYVYVKSHQVYSKYPILAITKCFHLGHNLKTLFKVNSNHQSQQLDLRFIHGLKALMIMSTVFGHVICVIPSNYFSPISLFGQYPSFFYKLQSMFLYTFVERSALVIDFFFLIGGFLVTHLTLTHMKTLPSLSFYVFIRWIRFVPSVVAIFCFTIAFQKLGSGPLFHEALTDPYVKPCYDYWWTHLLFINNFWKIDQMCGPNLWFIPVDFQLYILLYFALALYFRKPNYALVGSVIFTLCAVLLFLPMVALGITGIPRADYPIRFNSPAPLDSLRIIYTSPQFHIMPYFMGMFIAIYLNHTKKQKATKSKYGDLKLLTCLSLILGCILIQFPDHLQSDQSTNTNFVYGLYFMFIYLSNTILGAVTFYQLIFTGRSWIKQLLSSQFLVPLSRLSLGIYLLNPLLIWFNVNQNQQTPNLSLFLSFQFFCSIYLQSVLLSIVLFVLFEAPFHNLSRLFGKQLMQLNTKPTKPTNEQQVELTTIPARQ